MSQTSQQLIESQHAECVVSGINMPCEVTYGEPNSNSSVRFDFDFPYAIARFTWWSDSSYVSECLALDGRQIFSTNGFAIDASAATAAILELVASSELAIAT